MAFRSGVVLSRHKYNSCPSILLFAVCSLHPLTDILNLKLSMDEDGQKVAADEEVALAAIIIIMMMMMAMAATTNTNNTNSSSIYGSNRVSSCSLFVVTFNIHRCKNS